MNWIKKHKVLTGILIFIALIIIGAAASPKQTTKTTTVTKSSAGSEQTTTTQQKQPAWDAQAIYDQLTAGMTRAQAEQIIGKGSGTCTESASPGVGTIEICNYTGGFGSKGTISVDYMNGTIYSKTKLDF